MKKNILAAAVLLLTLMLVANNSYSQHDDKQKRTPEEMATKMADRMKEKLALSEDQYKQIYSLALSHAQNKISNREKYKAMDKESRKQLKKTSREEFNKQLEGILSKEQLEKLKQNKEKHMHKRGNKKKNKLETK